MSRLREALFEDVGEEIDQEELLGFTRSIAQVGWLLILLTALYMVAPGTEVTNREMLILTMVIYGAFVIISRYLINAGRYTRLRIAVDVLGMIAFITAVLIPTGGLEGSLLTLYLLPIVLSALTLGRWVTILNLALVAVCCVFVSLVADQSQILSMGYLTSLLVELAPFLLVGSITATLAADIHIAKNRIRALSETDELTGLANMRAFGRVHKREHDKADRYGRGYAILMVDMDSLKRTNDTYGHEIGNRAIILVANIITRLIRVTDCAARYGGDEFIVLLAETNKKHAIQVGHRIRNSVHNASIEIEGRMLRLGVSVGVAAYPDDSADLRDIVKVADHDMYQNKELRGRATGKPAPEPRPRQRARAR